MILSRDLQIAFVTEAQVEFSEETAEIACGWPQKKNCMEGKGRTWLNRDSGFQSVDFENDHEDDSLRR